MFSIGEFSKVTGLTVKTLRFYHEQGLLVPSHVEAGSGYRFYCDAKIETARVITSLRELEFSIAEIKAILVNHDDDADIVEFLQSRRSDVTERMRRERRIAATLDQIIHNETEARSKMNESNFQIEEKDVTPIRIASVRMCGKYSDCGQAFAKIGKKFGRHICGKPMMLHHDREYRADDANFDAAMPVRKGESTDAIQVQELVGGRCLSLMHLGPYEELSRSYERLMKHAKANGLDWSSPAREVYHKGPGMIFRGNPKKYLTEIQLFLSQTT